MIGQMLFRRLLGRGLNAGINRLGSSSQKPRSDMTPDERKQDQQARQAAKRAGQGARVARKLGRF